MPYSTISDLPPQVTGFLPVPAQHIFMAAYNSEYAKTPNESKCAAVAWAAVGKTYEKTLGGWALKETAMHNLTNVATLSGEHDIILQTLDTIHPSPYFPGGVFFAADAFRGTESVWDRTPVVYVPRGMSVNHIEDFAAFRTDPSGEAAKHGFRLAGRLENTRYDPTGAPGGTPAMLARIILDDAEAKQYAADHALGISTAFRGSWTENGILKSVTPNHVLVFTQCSHDGKERNCGVPNDAGANFKNTENIMADDEIKGILTSIKEMLSKKTEVLPIKNAEVTIEELQAELGKKDALIAALQTKLAEMDAAEIQMQNIRAEQAKTAATARWCAVKNVHQPALYHRPEDEETARKAFDADPAGYMLANIGNIRVMTTYPAKGAAAIGNVKDEGTEKFDVAAARGFLDPVTGRFA